VQVTTVASTTRFRDCLVCLPHRTVAAMRAGDIAIQLTVAIEHPLRAKRAFAWPPRITAELWWRHSKAYRRGSASTKALPSSVDGRSRSSSSSAAPSRPTGS